MKFDTMLATQDLAQVPQYAAAVEAMGFDALWSTESRHDPFLPLAVALTTTHSMQLGTAIAVAFPRSPTVVAHAAWDLQVSSHGRFILGLGTQVKGHNERRFGVRWEAPAKKLREMILALRAIWDCWQHSTPLNVQGEFYNVTLMPPAFRPEPHSYGQIPIYIAGVNPTMCRLAGELCEGLHVHPLHSGKYLRDVVLPNIDQGAAKAGRRRQDVTLTSMVFVITGDTSEEIATARERARQQIASYASTRNYRIVLDMHGWGEVGTRLRKKAAQGQWDSMAQEITDEMLATFAVSGPPEAIADKLHERYDGLLDRCTFYYPYQLSQHEERWGKIIGAFR